MANFFKRVGMGITAAFTAFAEAYSQVALVDDVAGERANFGWFPYRQARYDLYWALYENTAYGDRNDTLHNFSGPLKNDRGLYRHITQILNPIYRIVNFHEGHIWGGILDPDAEDEDSDSCLPVVTKTPEIRPEIARLWRDSSWQVNKDVVTRLGSALGDAAISIDDDPVAGKVRLCPLHPRKLADIQLDPYGEPTYVELSWFRPDPRIDQSTQPRPVLARYTETITLEGVDAVYRTYIDDNYIPWIWDTNPVRDVAWDVPYGFLPISFIPHIKADPDSPWGWAEGHAGLSKVFAVDDVASMFKDKIRRDVVSPMLLAGVNKPEDRPGDGEPQKQPHLFTNDVHSRSHPLTSPLDYKGTTEFLRLIIEEFKRHYPELQTDEVQPTVDISGVALEMSQRLAEDKVYTRRAIYDSKLVEATEKARAVAAWRGYRGYGKASLASYLSGDRAFGFGKRPVFRPLASQKAQQRLLNAQAMTEETKSLSLVTVLERDGWTPDQIDKALAEKAADAQQAVAQAGAVAQATAPPAPQPPAQQPQQGAA